MKKHELEHLLRAAGAIARDSEFIVFGSQAILGSISRPPKELLVSMEADIYPKNRPETVILVDGTIGERSMFHQTFGYYGHGVSPELATFPDGWEERLVPLTNKNTGGVTGLCVEVHDLAVSKLAAGREKDFKFVNALLRNKLVKVRTIERRLDVTNIGDSQRKLLVSRLHRLAARK